MAAKSVCSRCGLAKTTSRRLDEVYFRVPGRATLYWATPESICPACRVGHRGEWQWRRGTVTLKKTTSGAQGVD